jgi:hypothetical protein
MHWKCPSCGFKNLRDVLECGGGCGYEMVSPMLSLVSDATNLSLSFAITTVVGKNLLSAFAGDDALYASPQQFVLIKDTSKSAWFLEHCPAAKNPTFVSGRSAVSSRAKLDSTSIVTIGPVRLRLAVRFH